MRDIGFYKIVDSVGYFILGIYLSNTVTVDFGFAEILCFVGKHNGISSDFYEKWKSVESVNFKEKTPVILLSIIRSEAI